MRVRIIGASPAWPNPGGAHAGCLVETATGDSRLLVDCGPGVLARLRGAGLLPVDAIVVTHFHLDHWGDLVPWCWLALTQPESPAAGLQLLVPPGGSETLARFADEFGTPGMFEAAFTVVEYAPETAFAAARFTVEAVPVEHYGLPAFGLRVRGPDGRVVAFSGDSGPCPGLARIARGAALFVCEATLESPAADGPVRGHLSAEEAIDAAGTTRLVLTHRPVELPRPAGVEVAVEGSTIELD